MAMLLEPDDVTPDAEDKYNQTPLLWVAERYEDIMKMPLERKDVGPNTVDKDGREPRLRATGKAIKTL